MRCLTTSTKVARAGRRGTTTKSYLKILYVTVDADRLSADVASEV